MRVDTQSLIPPCGDPHASAAENHGLLLETNTTSYSQRVSLFLEDLGIVRSRYRPAQPSSSKQYIQGPQFRITCISCLKQRTNAFGIGGGVVQTSTNVPRRKSAYGVFGWESLGRRRVAVSSFPLSQHPNPVR